MEIEANAYFRISDLAICAMASTRPMLVGKNTAAKSENFPSNAMLS